MLVGIDASRANEDQKTGVGWYAWHLVEELKHIITSSHHHFITREPVKVILYTREELKGELANLPDGWTQKVLKWPLRRLWTQVRLSWEMLFHPPDILFIPAHVFPIIHPPKTVMMVHDAAALRFPKSYNWFERWYTVWSAKHAVKKLWKVIVPSEFTKNELLVISAKGGSASGGSNQSLVDEKIRVIPHGCGEGYKRYEIGDKRVGEVLKKYHIEKPFVLSVGRLEEKKNTARIIQSFNAVRQLSSITYHLSLVLVGTVGHGYQKVEAAINNSSYKKDIKTLGYVSPDDLPYIMNAAEVFVCPSLYEGFGLPILEAMACGAPVIASRGNALEEVGGDACVYVDATNVDEIASAIKRLSRDQASRKQLIEKGLERVKGYSWEKSASETARLLGLA
ncbi:MAG: glycosyltransferase family 4 protein [Candidatus Magasanikbacteria bacterium]|nr:glycosyltransferase family 4 protein [Candidatus Magasanikbacteria bacterium]